MMVRAERETPGLRAQVSKPSQGFAVLPLFGRPLLENPNLSMSVQNFECKNKEFLSVRNNSYL